MATMLEMSTNNVVPPVSMLELSTCPKFKIIFLN
jgi:hypothetical protein